MIALSSFGQNVCILHDENIEGYRKIQTDYLPLAKKGFVEFPFSLQCFSPSGAENPYYTLTFQINLGGDRQSLPKGSKMFLKLENDDIVEIETINEINEFDNEYQYMSTLDCMYYYMYPSYYVSPEQIDKLMQQKVIKIRTQVPWGQGYYDIPNDKTILAKHMCFTTNLIRMKLSIDERISTAQDQDALLKGF